MNKIARWTLIGLSVLAEAADARAQVKSVALHTPRLFGHFIGDVLHAEVVATVDNQVDLVPASVPQPGSLNAWLELIGSRVEQGSDNGEKSYRLYLDYQNFYPALDSRSLEVPGFALTFMSAGRPVTAQVPSWSFLISPLREVQPPSKASGADYMQPDVRPSNIDLRGERIATFGFLAAALIALGFLAHHLAWWPFAERAKRPFNGAARRIRKLLGPDRTESGYREALLTLHRAIDATAGHAVFTEDVSDFIDRAPVFSPLKEEFNLFFRSSRRVFFGDDVSGATTEFGADALVRFCDRLVSAERVGR
jgi:mxaA protein